MPDLDNDGVEYDEFHIDLPDKIVIKIKEFIKQQKKVELLKVKELIENYK